MSSTLRNQFGNNVAAYQLTSQIRQISKLVLSMSRIASEQNSYTGNPIYEALLHQRSAIADPITRIDVNINGKKKLARDLTEAEVAYVGIMVDFWNSFINKNANTVEFQNTAFADKNTHFSIAYSKYLDIYGGARQGSRKLGTLIESFIDTKGSQADRSFYEDAIFEARRQAYSKILKNLIKDYYGAFGEDELFSVEDTQTGGTRQLRSTEVGLLSPDKQLSIIKGLISKYGESAIKERFRKKDITFVDELHISKSGFNETLENYINLYVIDKSRSQAKLRLEKQKRLFIKDLIDSGMEINQNIDFKAVSLLKQRVGSDWFDSVTGEMFLYKTGDDGSFQMNPMLEAYFYSDVLLSNSYNEILFGRMFLHPTKYKPNKVRAYNPETNEYLDNVDPTTANKSTGLIYLHNDDVTDDDFAYDEKTNQILFDEDGKLQKNMDNWVMHNEASRLSASYKRTVNAGATVHAYLPGKYGIDRRINFAVVKDISAQVFNMLGISDVVDSMDGSGVSSPIQAILENWSSPGAEAGMDKKTIFGDTDATYGVPTLLKWAVYALTNDRRQMSMGSDISAEKLFIKMHSIALNKIVNITKYYHSEDEDGFVLYKDIPNQKDLTRTKNIYRYDSNSGKYYLISNLKQSGNNVEWSEIEVDRFGNKIPKTQPIARKREIKNLYDIDQIFGGAYCMEYSKEAKQLQWSNANNEILATIVCNESLKDKMVSYVVNKSAIKVGARNINDGKTLYSNNDEPLWTTQMSIQFGGIQMDADHELDLAEVTEMSQMISALIQNGYFGDEVNAIYQKIGEVVSESLKVDLDLLDQNDVSKIHQRLGKSLIKSFSTGSKDTIGLAQSYLLKAAEELANGNVDVKLPFSDPTLVGAFVADLVSNINKSGIKRHYAGIAAVLVPSRGMIQYYTIPVTNENGEVEYRQFMYNDFNKYVRDNNLIKYDENGAVVRDALWYIQNRGIFDGGEFVIMNPDGTKEKHPFINQLRSKKDADMGDTIIVVDSVGNVVDQLVLNNWDDFDKVRNLYSDNYRFFNWTCKPRDLRQADVTFSLSGKSTRFSMYDLDSVRALHYLRQLKGKKDFIVIDPSDTNQIEKINVIKHALGISEFDEKTLSTGLLSQDNIERYSKLLNRKLKQDLKNLDEGKDLGYNLAFGPRESFIEDFDFIGQNVDTRFAEIVMGRLHAVELGLQKDDSISEIKRQKEKFFVDRLSKDYSLPSPRDLSYDSYDACLVGPNNEKLVVVVKKFHKDDPEYLANWAVADNVFENRGGDMYYKNSKLCEAGTKEFYVKPSSRGNVNIMVVNDLDEIDELLEQPVFNGVRYRYNERNAVSVFKHQYKNYIDADTGILKRDIYIKDKDNVETFKFAKGKNFQDLVDYKLNTDDEFVSNLNENETRYKNEQVYRQAQQRYSAFLKQLQYVGARIPTQSMQSFMGLQLVGFSNSDVNEIYVPAVQTWLQGSDYDIDKLYVLSYELGKNGKLRTFSNLQDEEMNFDKLLPLSNPNGVRYRQSRNSTNLITKTDVNRVLSGESYESFNWIMRSGDDTVAFDDSVSDEDRDKYMFLLRKHSTTKLSSFDTESALKNSIVNRIINLLKHPRTQISGHTPISMEEFQKLAANSTLGNKEKSMTSDNPLVKFIMQVQNMVGKDVIGITAVGMKVFFATTSFATQRINEIADAIRRGDADEVYEGFYDITFADPLIDGEISTLANLNFEPILKALEDVQKDKTFALNDELPISPELASAIGNGSVEQLKMFVLALQQKSDIVDAAEGISELLSCATDNAKELILAKINATVDFADAWSYLISIGKPIKEIADLMMSPIFGIVSRYSKTNVFSDILKSSNPKTAINFVLGSSQLPGADLRSLKLVMGAYRKSSELWSNQCFIDKLLYKTYEVTEGDHKRGEIMLDINGNPIRRSVELLSEGQLAEVFEKGSDFRKNLFSILGDVRDTNKSYEISKILADHLSYLIDINTTSSDLETENYEDIGNEEDVEENFEDSYDAYENTDVEDEDDYDQLQKRVNSEDFAESDVFAVSRQQYIQLYRYVTKYVIPKNRDLVFLSGSDEIEKLNKFQKDVQPAVEEQQIIGSILGCNQGLKTNQYKFYSALKRVENFINERWQAKKIDEDDESHKESFNMIKYLEDSEYAKLWEQRYDEIKSSRNILKVLSKVPNFKEMYSLNRLAYRFMLHSTRCNMNFKLADALLNDPTQRLNEEEFKVLDKYSGDVLLINWLFLQELHIKLPQVLPTNSAVPYEQPAYTENYDGESDTVTGKKEITLSSSADLATFVKLFETWVVPHLKTIYPDNAFVRNITFGHKFSSTHNQNIEHARMSLDMMNIDSSVETQQQYQDILRGFNEIADTVIEDIGLSIKDLVFLYNTIVYKNSFSQGGFTRLMETINVSGDNALVNSWSSFLADLDAGMYKLGELDYDTDLTIQENGTLNFGAIKANIKDLQFRLSFTKNASSRFGVKLERDENGAVSYLRYVDMFDHSIDDGIHDILVKNPNANDWTMNMPILGNETVSPQDPGYKASFATRYTYSSKEIVKALSDAISERFGLSDHIRYISVKDIYEAWDKQNAGEETDLYIKDVNDLNRLLEANAFIHRGQIWVIGERLTNDTVLHEVLHLVFAAMKFNPDPEVNHVYYDLLRKAVSYYKSKPNLYLKLKSRYGFEYGSDFKEELLVHALTDIFSSNVKTKMRGYQFIDDVKGFAINLLNDILDTDIPQDVDMAKLGNTTLQTIATMFKSKLFSPEQNPLTSININLSQEVKTIKRLLIKAAEDPNKKNYIKYDC